MADNFYAKYPVTSGGGSGVDSLNGLTGALTLAAGTNITITPSGGNTLTIDASGGGSGTVTSVDMTVPASLLTVTGGPITTSGTFDVELANQNANLVFAGPSTGSPAAPTFRALTPDDLPAPTFTPGSIIFMGATQLAEDNANFFWDDIGKTLEIGTSPGPPGTLPFSITAQSSTTNAGGLAGAIYARHQNLNTATNTALYGGAIFEADGQVDVGQSTAATVGVLFQAYRNNGASDAGHMDFLVGSFGGSHQIGTDTTATTDILAGMLVQVEATTGNVNQMADFYSLSGNNSGATITNQFGIYISPPSTGSKHNWLSGDLLVGGSTFTAPGVALGVIGEASVTNSLPNDTAGEAVQVAVTSNTTTDGSITTIGIAGVATATVQSGATNDKGLVGMNFTVTRGDTTDQGVLQEMDGALSLLFHNSDAAGITNKAYGFQTLFFSESGTVTDLYDFSSQRIPAGPGVVTNHYGLYLTHDSDTPIKNWMSGQTTIGRTSIGTVPADASILFDESKAIMLPNMDTTTRDALVAVEGMEIYNNTSKAVEWYDGTSWTSGTGGGGANTALSNLASVAINTDLLPDTSNAYTLGDSSFHWLAGYISDVRANGTLGIRGGFSGGGAGVNITSGASTNSGAINTTTGAVTSGTSGNVTLNSGNASSAGVTGNVVLKTGTTSGTRGNIQFLTDVISTTTVAMTFENGANIQSGSPTGSDSPTLALNSGAADSGFNSGGVYVQSGGSDTNTGFVQINSGDAGVDSGTVTVKSGEAPGGNSGGTTVSTGSAAGVSGSVILQTGAAPATGSVAALTGSGDTSGGIAIATGTAAAGASGALDIYSGGSVVGNTGYVALQTGSATSGDSGDVILATGTATGTKGKVKVVNAQLSVETIGYGLSVAEGSDAKMGIATLVGGTVTVSNASVTAASRIFANINAASGTLGATYVTNIVPGVSFDIKSLSVLDTSAVAWMIVEAN